MESAALARLDPSEEKQGSKARDDGRENVGSAALARLDSSEEKQGVRLGMTREICVKKAVLSLECYHKSTVEKPSRK